METNQTATQTQNKPNSIFVEPRRVRKSKDGQYLIITLPDGRLIRKHVNFFKAYLGIEFTPKTKKPVEQKQAQEPQVA